jgi:predicted AlkP superfamily phosphohydrolase/phosphomutase
MVPLAIIPAMPRLAFVLAVLALAAGEAQAGYAPRVILIGVDGADPEIVERMIGEGKLPTFARLKREGASGRLRSVEPLLSPIVWTSLATGRWPEDHGVFDFVEVGPDRKATPITSLRRKVPALWNVASRYGKTSGFIGWYASYPAEEVKGFIVSDRLAFHQVKSARAAEGATYPTSLAEDLKREFGEPSPDLPATRARFAEAAAHPSADGEKRLNELARVHATAELYRRITPSLAHRFEPGLLSVYFEVVDACEHLFMEDAPPKRTGVSQSDSHAFFGTVDRCYEYQDDLLADVLRLAGPDTVTVVVSDHGFKSGERRPRTSGRADTGQAPLWHRLHGVVLAMGAGVERGAEIQGAGVLDIAPTVFTLLRVPVSRELPGKTLTEIAGRTAPRFVDRYAPLSRRAVPRIETDTEAVQRLAALGYLAGARAALPPDPEGRTASSYLNEGAARATRGDAEGALRAFASAVRLDPRNTAALVYAARLYSERGDTRKARELIGRALKLNPKDSGARLALASVSLREGNLREAAAALAAAGEVDDQLPLYHLLRARLADTTRRSEEAL